MTIGNYFPVVLFCIFLSVIKIRAKIFIFMFFLFPGGLIMQINKNSNTNFTGTFIIKTNNKQVKEAIPNIIKKGKQIFYNMKTEGDVVLVTRNKYDYRVKDFLEASSDKLEFEYRPEISTKSGLDEEIPSKLKSMLEIKNNCIINNLKTLNKFLQNRKLHLSKQIEYLQETVNTLRLNIENINININNNGLFLIRDNAKKRTIKSTGFYKGTAYVYVIPDSTTEESQKVLLGQNGKKVIKEYRSPKEIFEFLKKFNKALINRTKTKE